MNQFDTPILFIIFNRLDTTRRVFDEIKKMRPKKLFISADGPRKNKLGEFEQCENVRKICNEIDWDCEVKTSFQSKNMGCDAHVVHAINWFFSIVNEGIILEDDCLPSKDFFFFCNELLDYYRDDNRIMHISGNNFQFGIVRGGGDYYFSSYSHTWGWATWARAWKFFDENMTSFPDFKKNSSIKKNFFNKNSQKFWLNFFNKLYIKKYSFWDSKWMYAVCKEKGFSILPNKNLVSNIGFGKEATHTNKETMIANMETEELSFNIRHPNVLSIDVEADEYAFKKIFYTSFIKKIYK